MPCRSKLRGGLDAGPSGETASMYDYDIDLIGSGPYGSTLPPCNSAKLGK